MLNSFLLDQFSTLHLRTTRQLCVWSLQPQNTTALRLSKDSAAAAAASQVAT